MGSYEISANGFLGQTLFRVTLSTVFLLYLVIGAQMDMFLFPEFLRGYSSHQVMKRPDLEQEMAQRDNSA